MATDNFLRIGGEIRQAQQKKGGLEKIADAPQFHKCRSPEHNPPSHIVLEPGTYRYTCPACGKEQIFNVPYVGL